MRIPQAGVASQDPRFAHQALPKNERPDGDKPPGPVTDFSIRENQIAAARTFSTARLTRLEIGANDSLASFSIASVFFEP